MKQEPTQNTKNEEITRDFNSYYNKAKKYTEKSLLLLSIMMLFNAVRVMYDIGSISVWDHMLNYIVPTVVIILLINIDKLKLKFNSDIILLAQIIISLTLVLCNPLKSIYKIEVTESMFYMSTFYFLFYFWLYQYISKRK